MTLEDLYRLLRCGHIQAQGVVDTLTDPLLVLDAGLDVSAANPAFLQAFGVGREEALGWNLFHLPGESWNTPELRLLLTEVIPKARSVLDYEIRLDTPGQGPRVFHLSARRLAHPDNTSTHILLVFHDVTEASGLSRASAQKDILLAESQHRLKNLLAVVRALVSQTTATGRSGEDYREAVLGRLAVLADAQALELEDGDGSIDLQALLERALAPFSMQVRLRPGPAVLLSHAQVLPLSLILHELSTNAAKYGALSVPEGRVEVRWAVTGEGEGALLRLDWTETGGPPVTPPTRSGFGTRLMALSAGNDLSGQVEHRYEPTGLVTKIEFPLA
ncbi:sensor histidine kinase [Rubellimicrobium aerolatum]|uniref:histidine kinase n=1 Tax=Rubellimicrobium aerolatum TaxID=490979 RepID=A0ABW0SH70_9RHOB|nr:HWE histidine kinase domain-containing protein [Rubellimicrobium aerolatum]MBP1807714.1 two-component sensor histidine kinase [Rubellimicrobium aerolatum]